MLGILVRPDTKSSIIQEGERMDLDVQRCEKKNRKKQQSVKRKTWRGWKKGVGELEGEAMGEVSYG